jgi:hypothetical protein
VPALNWWMAGNSVSDAGFEQPSPGGSAIGSLPLSVAVVAIIPHRLCFSRTPCAHGPAAVSKGS